MRTMNINLTDEQAKLVEESSKTYGFANRSEFFRALLRYVYKINPNLVKTAAESPFAVEVAQKKLPTFEEIKEKVVPILKKNDVEFAGIFGSYARGEAKPESDLDFLVRFSSPKSLFDVIGIEQDLSELLGKKVQLVTEGAVHPYIRNSVEKDLIRFYGEGPKLH